MKKDPFSSAGRFIRSNLINASFNKDAPIRVGILQTLIRPFFRRKVNKIARAAFTLAVRRQLLFATEEEVRAYVREVLGRQDVFISPPEEHAVRDAEALVKRALGKHDNKGVPHYARSAIMVAILRDIVRRMSPTAGDELIAVAERRSGLSKPVEMAIDDAAHGLTSHVGQWYMDSIISGRASELSKPESTEDNLAVVDAAFELAAIRATGRRLNDLEVEEWATRLTTIVPQVSRDDIATVVKRQCGYTASEVCLDPDYEALVRVASTMAALRRMGLLDSEVRDVLIRAEELARSRGFEPATAL